MHRTRSVSHSLVRLTLLAAALSTGPAWSAPPPPPNPTGTDDAHNTAGGAGALDSATVNSIYNTAFGQDALTNNTAGDFNTGVGHSALFSNNASYNTAVGYAALITNTASYNTATGYYALKANTTGSNNTASGAYALSKNLDGSYNTAMGHQTLNNNQSGQRLTAVGAHALYSNGTGAYNTAVGNSALYGNQSGQYNTGVGYNALRSNQLGNNNVAVGKQTMYKASGSSNTAIGTSALYNSTTGSGNVALGASAGISLADGSNNIYIANAGVATESNVLRIGNGLTSTFISGISGVPLSGASVVVTAGGQLGVVTSSARYKRDVRDLDETDDKLLRLRPVAYTYKSDATATKQYGLIAEEVDQVYPELVVRNAENQPESVQYHELIPLLLAQIRKQQEAIAGLKAENERVNARLARLEAQGELANR